MTLKKQTNRLFKKSVQSAMASLSLSLTAVISLMMTGQAHAFLKDSSNQKVIKIGVGNNSQMQAVQVNTIPANNYRNQPNQQSYTPYEQYQYQYQYQETPQATYPTNEQVYDTYQGQQYTQSQYPQQNTQYQNQYQDQYSSQYQSQYQNTPAYSAQPHYPSNTYQNYTYQGQQSTYPTYSGYNNYTGVDKLSVNGVNSSAVLVYDMQTGRPLYEKNADVTRSIASISKVMTAMVALDAGLDMREELVLSADDFNGAKNASSRLRVGDRLSRSEFMLMMLMKSENPAAKTLARNYPGGFYAFIDAMNQKARSLGMYNTRFSDSSGLDPRNKSSANDLAKMMYEVATNPRYQTIRNFSTAPSYDFQINNYNSGFRVYSAANTSSLVRSGAHPILASKTGFIREAGYCVVMETNVNGRPAIVVLLGAKNSQNRWRDAGQILETLALR